MKTLIAGIALAVGFAATPAAAQPSCAQFEILGGPVEADYNPFSPQPLAMNFGLRVTRLTEGTRAVRFLLVDPTPGSGGPQVGAMGPQSYDVQWLSETGRQVFVTGSNTINGTNAATVDFGDTGPGVATTQFQLFIPRGQAAQAGLHSESLTVRYQCLSDAQEAGSESEQSNADVRLDVTVPRYAAAYIGSVGQIRGTIAFGQLTPQSGNLEQSISITALSTVPYEVRFESENGGLLKRSTADPLGIAYRMRYDGVAVVSGATITCPATPAPIGQIDEFEVALDGAGVGSLPAGDYADVVTITFQPRDGGLVGNCQSLSG